MEKYRNAYKHWLRLVAMTKEKEGCTWETAAMDWWQYLQGIIEVAIYDIELTPEEFAEINGWHITGGEQDA